MDKNQKAFKDIAKNFQEINFLDMTKPEQRVVRILIDMGYGELKEISKDERIFILTKD